VRDLVGEDLLDIRYVSSAQLSPDGERIAVAVSGIDSAGAPWSDLRLIAPDGTNCGLLARAGRSVMSPVWSPDGSRIALLAEGPTGIAQITIIDPDADDLRVLTALVHGVTGPIAWSPDGVRIAFTAVPDDVDTDVSVAYRIDRAVYRADGVGLLDQSIRSLFVVSVDDGAVTRLTHDRCMHDAPQWSPDGSALLVMTSFDPNDTTTVPWPRIVQLGSDRILEPTRNWGFAKAASWLHDGSGLTFVGRPGPDYYWAKDDLWVMRFGFEPQNRTAGLAVGVGGVLLQDMAVGMRSLTPRLDRRRKGAFVRVQNGGRAGIAWVSLAGPERVEMVIVGDRGCEIADVDDARMLVLVSDFLNPLDLIAVDLATGEETRLTALNDDLIRGIDLPAVTAVRIPAADGDLDAWWVAHESAGAVGPIPCVLAIHGGPYAAFGHIFRFETLLLAARGFGVLLVNYHGSSGYGDEFSTAILGGPPELEFRDLMAAVDHVIALGWADPERLAVYGASYGGTMTCWTVGHTARFVAAVAQTPVTDRAVWTATADIGATFYRHLGAEPWEAPELYALSSAITFAHRATTPTLLIHNECDWRCPGEQVEIFYRRLKAVGCETEMVRIPGASHSGTLSGPAHGRLARNAALVSWISDRIASNAGTIPVH
jgi:dipeptidyl aminopeptidase/acylaminoacyl peptidase